MLETNEEFYFVRGDKLGPLGQREVIKIANTQLGLNYFLPEDFKNPNLNWVIARNYTDYLVGFASISSKGVTGIITDVAVRPKFQSKGVGTQLIAEAVEMCNEKKKYAVRCPAWATSQRGVHLAKSLEANGFAPLNSQPRDDGNGRLSFQCPVCGSPCKCSVVIYHRSLV